MAMQQVAARDDLRFDETQNPDAACLYRSILNSLTGRVAVVSPELTTNIFKSHKFEIA
jgi:hypothetical protein